MVLALASFAVLWAMQSVAAFPPFGTETAEQEIRRLESAIEQVDAAILRHRYQAGLDIPVVPMMGPVRQAGYRPGDIADGHVERAFQPVTVIAPVSPPLPVQLRGRYLDKMKQLDQLRREHPLPQETR